MCQHSDGRGGRPAIGEPGPCSEPTEPSRRFLGQIRLLSGHFRAGHCNRPPRRVILRSIRSGMQMNAQQRYEHNYVELIRQFADETGEVDPKGIVALHLPVCGLGYEQASIRIAFVGEETRGWGKMSDFLADAKTDPRSPGRRWESSIHTFEFTRWTNNFGRTFWDTVFRLLAVFNGVTDWKLVKKGKSVEILRSFVLANSNSLEGFAVTARKNGAQFSDWSKFKIASRKFDRLQLLLDSFNPTVVVIMNWDSTGEYFPDGLVWEQLGNHLLYAFEAGSGAHIFKTAHPTWLSKNRLYSKTLELIAAKWNELSKSDASAGHKDQT